MSDDSLSVEKDTCCRNDGGRGIGAGHVCLCVRVAGHPMDSDRPHGCTCGALWAHRSRVGGLHACKGCGLELDGDDPNDRCDECVFPPEKGDS